MVTVGIDPHKNTHTAVLIDTAGAQLGPSLTVPDTPDAVARLLAWAVKAAAGQPLAWAIEDGRGLARRLADGLTAAGQPVHWVPVRLMAAARRRGPARGKSDPVDALAVAHAAANPDNADYLAPVNPAEPGRDIRHLLDERRDRIGERTRLINTLRWRLHELGSGLAPTTLTTLTGPRRLTTQLTSLPAGVLRDLALTSCDDLTRLTRQIKNLTKDITTRIRALTPTLLARPGVGAITAATLLAELGDPTRVRTSAAFARLNGTAPIPVWTSNHERHRLDHGGNRRLNHAIHTVAFTQARHHPPAQALLQRHHPTKGTRGALRVLKRHLSDALYRDLITDTTALT